MTAYPPVQDGQVESGVLQWEEASDSFYAFLIAPAGVAFQLGAPFDLASAVLTLHSGDFLGIEGAPSGAVNFYLAAGVAPAAWSDGNRPTPIGGTFVASAVVTSTPGQVVIPLDTSAVRTITSSPSWNGRLAIVVQPSVQVVYAEFYSSEHATEALRPSLDAVAIPAHETGDTRPAQRLPIRPDPDSSLLG